MIFQLTLVFIVLIAAIGNTSVFSETFKRIFKIETVDKGIMRAEESNNGMSIIGESVVNNNISLNITSVTFSSIYTILEGNLNYGSFKFKSKLTNLNNDTVTQLSNELLRLSETEIIIKSIYNLYEVISFNRAVELWVNGNRIYCYVKNHGYTYVFSGDSITFVYLIIKIRK
jgi:hypothetical protein